METNAGILLTKKQEKNIKDLDKILSEWDKSLCINAIAGVLHVMLLGDTKQNPIPEISTTGGFNPDNIIYSNSKIHADGGDW